MVWGHMDKIIEMQKMKATVTLDVPYDKEKRLEIRTSVEAFLKKNQVMPPVSYETLSNFADLLIKNEQWEEKYHAFVMVCFGNLIWRPVVGAIPYNRRIMLLPHCLRNLQYCKAEQDELGLLCSECGKCSISGFLREAENLGYVALVTEGTTITTRLIESGKVDAVIGVGCMEVLQKMFAAVSKYAIPSIGIPLVTCGCIETMADSDWIKNEIYHFKEDSSIRMLNLNYLKNKTSSIFGEEQILRIIGPAKNKTEKIALESLLSGGQRLRPFIAVLAYEAFVKEPDPSILNLLALSVECFHKASLIHDDIEDNDDTRYGTETIHNKYGVPVAINTGDFLIGEGYRIIAECDLPSELIRDSIRIISRGHSQLTLGQGAELISIRSGEILSLADMLEVFKNKTAAAFKVSLLLGATLGGADKDTLDSLDLFSKFVGIAYQIKDDLSDYQGKKGDIAIRRFSVLLSYLNEKLSAMDKEYMLNAMKTGDNQVIFDLIVRYDVQKSTELLLSEYINNAKNCLDKFSNIGLKLALHEILGKIFKEYI